MCARKVHFSCRWTPRGHRFRRKEEFGEKRGSRPPEPRNHDECVQQGKDSDAYVGSEKAHTRHSSGINRSCPLSFLHQFDIVWDVCPDMMHIVKNFFEKLTFKMFGGARVPTWVASKNRAPAKGAPNFDAKQARHLDAAARWKKAVDRNNKCIFSAEDQALVDRRVKHLAGTPTGLRTRWYFYIYF